MDKFGIIAGRSNPGLAKRIANYLGGDLIKCKIINFANGEIYVEFQENIRNKNLFFVQTGANSSDKSASINDYYVEAIQVADACNRSGASSISIICPTFPYARSDKKDKPRVSIMSSVIANGYKNAGFSRIISIDIHSGQLQGMTTLPFDNLYAKTLHINNLRAKVFRDLTLEQINEQFVLIAPDMGSSKRIRAYAEKLQMKCSIMDKQRDYSKIGTIMNSVLIGTDVKDKIAIIVDDMADTMGTMLAAINDLKTHGVKSVIIIVTHGVLSDPAISRINECELISQVIVTDTIDQTRNLELCPKLSVVGTASLFGEAIKRIICGGSLSELFE